MIFTEGENSIAGYDPRFILVVSALDYLFFYIDGQPLTWTIGFWLGDILPFWLGFIPFYAFYLAGVFLMLLGPFVLFWMISKGWKSLNEGD